MYFVVFLLDYIVSLQQKSSGHLRIYTNKQRWACATSKVAPLPLRALKSSVATATRYSSSKVARYRCFNTKVAALPATSYFEQRVIFLQGTYE